MTKGGKRLMAVLLSVLMVFSVIPMAAMADTNDPVWNTNDRWYDGTYTSGETVSGDHVYPAAVKAEERFYHDGQVRYAGYLTEYNIDGVVAADAAYATGNVIDVTNDPNSMPFLDASRQGVIVTANTGLSYDSNLKDQVQTALNTAVGNDANKHADAIQNFTASGRNKLSSIRITYSGSSAVKQVKLYAKVSERKRCVTQSNTNSYATTRVFYDLIGTATVYPYASYNSLNLNVTVNPTSIPVNQTGIMVATVGSGVDVEYVVTPNRIDGVARLDTAGTGMWRITANQYATSGNSFTVKAYLMQTIDAEKGRQYVGRASNGSLGYATKAELDNKDQFNKNGVVYTAITASRTVSFSTTKYNGGSTGGSTGGSYTTSMKFNQTYYACEVGDRVATQVTMYPYGSYTGRTYVSSNPSVATVSDTGVITGLREGTATIYVYATNGSGAADTAYVSVTRQTASITLNKNAMELEVGETGQLTASVVTFDNTNKTVSWTSSDSTVASVSGGKVTAKKAGTAVITAKLAANPNKSVTCAVIVKNPTAKITVPETLNVKVGQSANLNATIAQSANKTLLYVSDNTKVAAVDTKGNVVGVKAGTAMITVMSASNQDVKAYCVVTVTAGGKGVINETGKYVKNSKYYRSTDVTSAEVKTAIAELKGAKKKNVTVNVTAESNMNKVVFTRYAMARLADYADALTVNVNGEAYEFDAADLAKMDIGRPVYVYTTPEKCFVKYKNASGVYKTIKVTPVAK